MGQQQLLLIVLGVIIVGIMIVVGINLFQVNAVEANRDAVAFDVQYLAHRAQAYYLKPTNFGGGGRSFVGYTIPTSLFSNQNGSYSVSTPGTATQVVIQGVGVELGDDGVTGVTYQTTVTPTTITTIKIN